MKRKLTLGTRVRLKPPAKMWGSLEPVRTATYLFDGRAIPDGIDLEGWDNTGLGRDVCACDWQWAVMRDQTANPEHGRVVAYWRERVAS